MLSVCDRAIVCVCCWIVLITKIDCLLFNFTRADKAKRARARHRDTAATTSEFNAKTKTLQQIRLRKWRWRWRRRATISTIYCCRWRRLCDIQFVLLAVFPCFVPTHELSRWVPSTWTGAIYTLQVTRTNTLADWMRTRASMRATWRKGDNY